MKKYPVLFFALAAVFFACSSPTGGGGGGSVSDGSGGSGGGRGGSRKHAILYVTPEGAGTKDGSSWDNASSDIQEMIDDADGRGAQIWVAAGVYKPAHIPEEASTDSRHRTFWLKPKVRIYGGFSGDGTEDGLGERDWENNKTILSGDFNNNDGGNAIDGFIGMDENAYHVVLALGIPDDEQTILDGFTITGGNANGDESTISVGVHLVKSSWSGGVVNWQSSPVLTNVTISGNQAGDSGGGGMSNAFSSSPVLTNVIVSNNRADFGGGMFNWGDCSPVLTNVVISGNQASFGGGIFNSSSSPVLTNVTISGNQAGDGGGMYNWNNSAPEIRNSIIWDNGTGVTNNVSTPSTPSYEYSLVEGGVLGGVNGNLAGTTDPQFVNSSIGDYRLKYESLARNAGTIAFYKEGKSPDLSGITTDLDGNPRTTGVKIDMGAYQY
ncbi:MAG: right-handed parallel beta-helix repeat-containing protein [Treponema sp.]|jgi:hypothetical protein|nr:right-handed parallel beta-helix repeat-containing protein [Treponema sp.]